MTEASSLRGLEIVSPLEVALGGKVAKKSAVITCWHMAGSGATNAKPKVDLVLRGVPIFTDRSDRCTLAEAVQTFDAQLGGLERIYLLCDRHAEGIEPPRGMSWDEATRTQCVQVCLVACVAMLFRSPDIQKLLRGSPATLVVGMIQENEITILSDESERMIRFIEQNLPQ